MTIKIKYLHVFLLFFALCAITFEVYGFSKEDFLKLMKTNSCQYCDLTKLDLTSKDLTAADISRANLTDVDFAWTELYFSNIEMGCLEKVAFMVQI